MLKRLMCLFGKHERSAGGVTEDSQGVFRSVCRTCGCALERDDATRNWATPRKTAHIKAARAAAASRRGEKRGGSSRNAPRS